MGDLSVRIDPLRPPSFDETVRLAAKLVGTPMAAISLLGKKSQWFKAEVGLNLASTPIEHAFCRYAVASGEPFAVPDATGDDRFSTNPLVTSGPGIRAYAGAPLLLPDGSVLGTVCVLDTVARDFVPQEFELLAMLARQVVVQLQLESLIERQSKGRAVMQKLRGELDLVSRTDVLTGLLNRRGLVREFDRLLRGRGSQGSRHRCPSPDLVVTIDVDDFKAVNDTHGHATGDRVLAVLGSRLRGAMGDYDLAARLGADTFVFALSPSEVGPTEKVAALIDLVTQPVAVSGVTIELVASVGMVPVTTDGGGAVTLIDCSHRAMQRAKQLGGAQSCEWSVSLDEADDRDRGVRSFVRSVVRSNELCVFFQPVIDLKTGALVRREALLRWSGTAPVGLDPGSFVAAAEEIGLISEVGRMVLDQSCAAVGRWQRAEPSVGVAVNISPLQIDRELVVDVSVALRRHDIDPSLLTLEITESSLFERSISAIAVLQELHEMGVRISIDDFGSGYSSMAMLCSLPIDEVKIDRQFCTGADPQFMVVASAAIELGHALGLHVVAEGIETREVLDALIDLGCESGQGFLFGKPSPASIDAPDSITT